MASASIQELYQLLDAADRAGDREGAEFLAGEIQKWEGEQNRLRRQAETEQGFQDLLKEQAEGMSPVEAALVGAGKTFTDWGRSIKGGYLGLTGQDEELEALKQRQADEARLYAPLAETHRKSTFVGEMLPYLATAPLGGGAGAAAGAARGTAGAARALGANAGEQAPLGAGLGALGAPVGENLTGAAIGGALGGALPYVGRGLGNLGRGAMERVGRARELTELGVPLTPGQRLGSSVVTKLEEVAERMPFVSFGSTRAGQQRAVNRLAAESIGESTESLTGEVLDAAARRIGQGMDEVLEETGSLPFGRPFMTFARQSRRAISGQDLEAPQARKMLDRLLGRAKQGGKLPAREFQDLNTRLTDLLASPGLHPDERRIMSQLQRQLWDMAEETMPPPTLSRWQQLRGQWKDLKTLDKVTNLETGNVSAKKLYNQLGGLGRRRGRERTALQQQTPLAQAARIGQELSPKIPDSGTPAGLLPWLAGGAALGSEDYSGFGAGALGLLAAPYAYRGAGRLLATPMQAGAGRSLQAMSQPASINLARSLGAGLTPGLLEE